MARCGTCAFYQHRFYHNFSDESHPFITSMTICSHASDGLSYRGENCVPCNNYRAVEVQRSFFYPENQVVQLTLF